jgi:hypothetical protein
MTALAASARREAGRRRPARPRMAWITWRQHRAALAGVAVLLGGCALALGITGLRIQAARASLAHSGCALSGALLTSRCGSLQAAAFSAGYPLTSNVPLLAVGLLAIPVLIGMFAAAPLVAREYESGTFKFAWTQAAGRTRWAVAKLTLLAVVLTAAASAFGALVSWWLAQADPVTAGSRWQPSQFGLTAVTFAAWTLVAVAAGALAGALIRRTVPAMAVTAAVMAVLAGLAYKKLDGSLLGIGPVVRRAALLGQGIYQPGSGPVTFVSGMAVVTSSPAGSWPLRSWVTGPRAQVRASLPDSFLNLRPPAQNAWLASHHVTLWTAYQPAGRFWVFQGIEGAIGLLLALLLGAATVWLVRRRAA